jgi:hypothetical protein
MTSTKNKKAPAVATGEGQTNPLQSQEKRVSITKLMARAVALAATLAVTFAPAAMACELEEVPLAGPELGFHLCAAADAAEPLVVLATIAGSYGYDIGESRVVVADSITVFCPQHADLVEVAL